MSSAARARPGPRDQDHSLPARAPVLAKLPGPHRGLRIGLFGGSFNPAHSGHRHVAETALTRLQLDWVWWIVARGNPLKSNHGDFGARRASANRQADHPRMRVSAIETRLGVSYTRDTLVHLKARCPATDFVWIMGADNLAGFHRWAAWKTIAETVPVAVVSRPGIGPEAAFSRFASTYRPARIAEADAPRLASTPAPAWTLLHAPLDPASSTTLRARGPGTGDRLAPEG